jgi:hypothetical protein
MAYDEARRRIILFGGVSSSPYVLHNDTWMWDGTTWTELSPPSSPPPMHNARATYDPRSQALILYTGVSPIDDGVTGQLWSWDGSTWINLVSSNEPPQRAYSAIASDISRGKVILFGGGNAGGPPLLDDTWEWGPVAGVGMISVTTNLNNASFLISGPATFSGGGKSFFAVAPPGSYTISYGPTSGYTTPPSSSQTLSASDSISFTGSYLRQSPKTRAGYVITIDGVHIASVLNPSYPPDYTHYLFDAIDPYWSSLIEGRIGKPGYFDWSRNIYNTDETVIALSTVLEGLSKTSKDNHSPFVVMAHSWGTVLAFLAISRNNRIAVDKFVTLGSPLNAQNQTVGDFTMEALTRWGMTTVKKPTNVRIWSNYWAGCDPISGAIGTRIGNYQITTNYIDGIPVLPTSCHSAYYGDYSVWQQIMLDVYLTK